MPERERVDRVVGILNGDYLGLLKIEVIRWETRFYSAQSSFQDQIVEAAECDLVIGILRSRLGTPLPPNAPKRADGSGYPSGTAYEIETALAAQQQKQRPQLYMFRSSERVRFNADCIAEDQQQFAALEAFWRQLFVDENGRFLRAFQSFADTADFEQQLERCIRQWLHEQGHLIGQPIWNTAVLGSPYRGLEAFDETHQRVFFGRRSALDACWNRLLDAHARRNAFLLILGGSGVGKSSLVRSGLVPRFRLTLNARGFERARVANMKPGADPLNALHEALSEALPGYTSDHDLNAALDLADRHLGLPPERLAENATALLLVIDQFEEALNCTDVAIAEFAQMLNTLLADQRIWLVATFRTDRYSALSANAALAALKDRGASFDLASPSSAELEEIVRAPAQAAGLKFEREPNASSDLADALLHDVRGSDALALLQLTLAQLYEARQDSVLRWDTYRAIGGVRGAVVNAAEQAYAKLTEAGQAALPAVIAELTAGFGDSGEALAQPIARHARSDDARSELIEILAKNRLLIIDEDAVRVAHEALLRNWPRAVALLEGIHDAIEVRERLQKPTTEWQRHGSELYLLPPGPLLASAIAVREGPHAALLPQAEGALIDASVLADRKKRSRRTRRLTLIAAGMSVLALIAVVAAIFALQQRERAQASFGAAVQAVDGLSRNIARSLKAARGISAETVESVLNQARLLIDGISATDPQNSALNQARVGMLLGFADTYRSVARSREADQALDEAIALLAALEQATPNAPQLRRFRVEAELGLSQRGYFALDLAAAKQHAKAAFDLAQGITNSDVLKLEAARRLGAAQYLDGDLNAAAGTLAAALAAQPATDAESQAQFAALLTTYGTTLLDLSRIGDARAAFTRARNLAESAFQQEPGSAVIAEVLLRTRRGFSRALLVGGDALAARGEVDQAITLGRELVAANPNAVMVALALQDLLSFSAELSEAAREREAQRAALTEAANVIEATAKRDPDNLFVRSELAFAKRRVGEVAVARRDFAAAVEPLEAALALDRQVLAATPNRPFSRRYLAATLEQIGRLKMHTGKLDEALTAHLEALAIRESLQREFPQEPLWLRLVAISKSQLMYTEFKRGNLAQALAYQRDSEEGFRQVAQRTATPAARRSWIDAQFETISVLAEAFHYDEALAKTKQLRSIVSDPALSADYSASVDQVEQLILRAQRSGKRPGSPEEKRN